MTRGHFQNKMRGLRTPVSGENWKTHDDEKNRMTLSLLLAASRVYDNFSSRPTRDQQVTNTSDFGFPTAPGHCMDLKQVISPQAY